ncbi:MAG: ATP-binding cassette domain-containing protein [Pseudomonadales bacterium]|nr:ATP-binding cassette domain-containing protein [Pseudomonadales bacterium]MDP6472238.1 ATP-binding cassette domain-containing protein [Pseudomonadales bacterium]MDP6826510.1 ATP-binding cassette domain-containing protein [Pseudomonadales bacterium]MDP6970318.1 ATP-binding cassette domain-containing protein [Pseudomonadales bacterium]
MDLDFGDRWDTLSHGERKRAQFAHALWQRPVLLAIDEPTNHIDRHAREFLLDSLKRLRGVGLLVSHDDRFLDRLSVSRWRVTKDDIGDSVVRVDGY